MWNRPWIFLLFQDFLNFSYFLNSKNLLKNLFIFFPSDGFDLTTIRLLSACLTIEPSIQLGCMSETSCTWFLVRLVFCDFWTIHKAHLHDFFRRPLWHDKGLKKNIRKISPKWARTGTIYFSCRISKVPLPYR